MQPPTTPDPLSGANRTRQDAARLGANHPILQAYAEAVRRMKALPSSDPRSWSAQATIHLQACPHGNWWFLPWHRGYVWRFEQICRELLGDEGFALPYWNWSRDARIPPGFFDASSPLFQPGRLAGANSSAASEMVSAAVVERLMNETNFEIFGSGRASGQRDQASQGPLEGTPHNHIHVFVGGEMANFIAPVDPLFWLHHANVDRLWESWNQRGGRNPTDPAWGGLVFRDFFDRRGGRVQDNSADLAALSRLDYRYDQTSVAQGPSLAGLRATAQNFGEIAPPTTLARVAASDLNDAPVAAGRAHSLRARGIPAAAPALMARSAAAGFAAPMSASPQAAAALANPERALIRVAQIDAPNSNENVIVRVFVNHPNLTAQTPVSDPHYVGSFGFFQTRFAAEVCSTNGLKASYLLDATEALRRVGGSAAEADVQLMPVDVQGRPLAGTEFYARQAEILAV